MSDRVVKPGTSVVVLRRASDGLERAIVSEWKPAKTDDDPKWDLVCYWRRGNYECDCNRRREFDGRMGPDAGDVCGESAYWLVRIEVHDEVLFDEKRDGPERPEDRGGAW
jgi:hypothetical protein